MKAGNPKIEAGANVNPSSPALEVAAKKSIVKPLKDTVGGTESPKYTVVAEARKGRGGPGTPLKRGMVTAVTKTVSLSAWTSPSIIPDMISPALVV
jgi:hypothetical protein